MDPADESRALPAGTAADTRAPEMPPALPLALPLNGPPSGPLNGPLEAASGDLPDDGLEAPLEESLDPSARPPWALRLEERIAAIDAGLPGDWGVYVKHLDQDVTVRWRAEHDWYLASTVKVPVAIAVLERVDAGELSLQQSVELHAEDFVDGAGDLKLREPGDDFTIAELLEMSIENSDSIATDMLIRLLGVEQLNARVQSWTGSGFGPLTTIQQVRYDAYGLLDPRVATLPGRVFLVVRAAGDGEARLSTLAAELGLTRGQLGTPSLEDLFERYYESGTNTASLDAFGTLLEDLARGDLLEPASKGRLLDHMQRITTGKRRIEAGLPPRVPFAQKTGTQIARACNVGIVHPTTEGRQVIVAACAARYDHLEQAERAFEALGRALPEAGVLD